jgi:hypothetical protein
VVRTGAALFWPSAAFTTAAAGHTFGTEEALELPAVVAAVVGTVDLDAEVAAGFDASVAVAVALVLELELHALKNAADNARATRVIAIHRVLLTIIEPPERNFHRAAWRAIALTPT